MTEITMKYDSKEDYKKKSFNEFEMLCMDTIKFIEKRLHFYANDNSILNKMSPDEIIYELIINIIINLCYSAISEELSPEIKVKLVQNLCEEILQKTISSWKFIVTSPQVSRTN